MDKLEVGRAYPFLYERIGGNCEYNPKVNHSELVKEVNESFNRIKERKANSLTEKKLDVDFQEVVGQNDVSFGALYMMLEDFIDSPQCVMILKQIESINKQYGNSWADDGAIGNLIDIKEKLSRLQVIVREGGLSYEYKTMDNFGNVIFDIFVRSLLLILLDDRVRNHLSDKFGVEWDDLK